MIMSGTKHFKVIGTDDQFVCSCCGLLKTSQEFVEMLEDARQRKEKVFPENPSIRINCSTRCVHHNKKVGGVLDSSHVAAPDKDYPEVEAADIDYDSMAELIALVMCLSAAGFRRIGYSLKKKYIHVDCDHRKKPDIWEY
jgi:hypothetical protein